ncbi:MAG: hypothetical protein ACRYGF_08185 [Janthinobacterium lividum]
MRFLYSSLALGTILISSLSSSAFTAKTEQTISPTSQAVSSAKPRHIPDPQRQARRLAQKLGLTMDQQSKLEPILADRDHQLQRTRTDVTLLKKDRRAKLQSIKKDSVAKVNAVLTPAQKQLYEQMKQARKAHKQQEESVG